MRDSLATPALAARSRLVVAALVAVLLTTGALVHHPPRAAAGVAWCWDDPVVQIGPATVSITIGAFGDPTAVAADVVWSQVVITVPTGVSTSVVSSTTTYFKERVKFVTGTGTWNGGTQPLPVGVAVTFQSKADYQTAMQIAANGTVLTSATGTTAAGMTARFLLK